MNEFFEQDGILWVRVDLIQSISTTSGFNVIFERNLTEKPTFLEAYEATEAIHEHAMGARKYSCYDSFSHVRKTHLKK